MAVWPILLVLGIQTQAPLPPGVGVNWDMASAWRETTPTREKVCLNGLWRWQPDAHVGAAPPVDGWGWFKVPGCWPGITDYMQKDSQTVYANDAWKNERLGGIKAAWYQREFTTPPNWNGRRIIVSASYVNSLATLYVDGHKAGDISFPAGEADVTEFIREPIHHTLSIEVVALPLKGVLTSYSDTNSAKTMAATVNRRGLCGDVFLESRPAGPTIDDFQIETSVRTGTITVRPSLSGFLAGQKYTLVATIFDHGKPIRRIQAPPRYSLGAAFGQVWRPTKLWDLNTPQNQYEMSVDVVGEDGELLDRTSRKPFGFRELWIKGKDFMLNGTRVWFSCVPIENAAVSAGMSSYASAKETFHRLKQIGVNMVYTHNYDCNPGSFLSFDEILRAADDEGVLVALTQPHFGDYDWSKPDADTKNGYARHAEFFVDVAGNHPSVIAYATSHNATGYNEDTNPDMIDGIHADRDGWASNNVKKALRAQAIINRLDPSRIVYHHSSGNLGTMHTMNFYLNFVPIQEFDDWYEHWAAVGVKPAFMVEYGVPFSWDWTMYRGWYKGERSFGNAQVPWEYCMAEWNAQFLGDDAYKVGEQEKRNLRWEANKFKTGGEWFRWDYPYPPGSTDAGFDDQQKVWAEYTTDNWRAFRTWGVSGTSPWETSGEFWRVKPGVNKGRVELKTDWEHLQRPGYSPDFVDGSYERRDLAYAESDWVPTVGAKSLLANNAPVLAYIGGEPGAFTDKTHVFHAGDAFEKQLIVVNNSRETIHGHWTWTLMSPQTYTTQGYAPFTYPTGEIGKIPIKVSLPRSLSPGSYELTATASIGKTKLEDSFKIDVVAATPKVKPLPKLAIYDPVGETTKLLTGVGIAGTQVHAGSDLSGFSTVIVGKHALTVNGPGLDLSRVAKGLKVVMFEQTSDVLEKRFGFRVQEYGLRNVFPRTPDHPILAGLNTGTLRDWRGSATNYPPRGTFEMAQQFYGVPSVVRSGIVVPRVWRCGNRGSVASVLIEKPAIGDFLPIVDGGFSLEYSPLLEYHEGAGCVIFCQMDVTGRTEADPAAQRLVANLVNYVGGWKAGPQRSLMYSGGDTYRQFLASAGFAPLPYIANASSQVGVVLGPDSVRPLGDGPAFALSIGYRDPVRVPSEYIESNFAPPSAKSPFYGIGPADVYSHAPTRLTKLGDLTHVLGGGVLGDGGTNISDQLAPWEYGTSTPNTKRTFRRTSFVVSRILGNLGVHARTPLLERFAVGAKVDDKRWLKGFYLDTPVDTDDPYRFFGW